METKEQVVEDDRPPSPYEVFQQISEEAVRVASEAIQSVYNGSNSASNSPVAAAASRLGHRRVHSEIVSGGDFRSNSFQKWKTQMQKAFQKSGYYKEEQTRRSTSFNPEILANQKRLWYQHHSKKLDISKYKEPTSLFEHFVIVGLPSDTNLKAVEDVFAKRKTWELQMANSGVLDTKIHQYRGPTYPALEPQILFKYPPGKKLAMHTKDLPAFCFPEGVKARLLERTPSMSDLNEVIHGQEHLGRDDLSFIFSLKGADSATLYGVCLHVPEIVQRSPGIISAASSISQSSGGFSRFLVSAPRCYCLLTRVPFFELHYEILNSIVTQERLNRITQFVSEMNITDYVPSLVGAHDMVNENIDYQSRKYSTDWTAFAIPVDSAAALTAAAAGIISDDEVQSFSFRVREPETPESIACSEASDISQAKEIDKEIRRGVQILDGYASETVETNSDEFEREFRSYANSHALPEVVISFGSKGRMLERHESSESLFSSVRSMGSEDEDDEVSPFSDKNVGDDAMMKWAKEHKSDLLQIICCYHARPIPPHGEEMIFQPLDHLQSIKYSRPAISCLGLYGTIPDIKLQKLSETTEVNVRLAAAEEALSLSIWAIATVCRALSLQSILALFAGVLLEKQVVVVCPNLGVLSAIILSLIPMIRPFEWQSLLLPVLPRKLFDFLDAPVPFIVGIQRKPADLKMKTSNLIHVNVNKDKVKACNMPPLPRHKELISELGPIHARLSCENSIAKRHPVYKCNVVQAEAAGQFLNVMRRYLELLCSDLRSHTITSVQSNSDKVSLLFKDSFIDSFPNKDRAFIKLLVDTQLFSVLSDSRLSSYEHE
ncbi:DENN (AEX-3) domain-containing protein [Thalictrum thalictroides]|uniref:DENN (AEX-3) domain-containing protein n=1 Tax=Thalictrum thalictroides TaxID=46969 RepID=A0A7J6V2W5_THATH|nr:DENN (AEX-3) domain-containing protein [Thalictrum thalictroides]